MDRRTLLVSGTAAVVAGCTTFDTHSPGRTASCDIVSYPLNTGLSILESTFASPVFLDPGDRQAKWVFNHQGGNPSGSHDAAPVVVGGTFGGEPSVPDTLWIRSPDDAVQGDSFLFSYGFCVDAIPVESIPLGQKFAIRELHVKSSDVLERVTLNGAILYGTNASSPQEFEYDPQNPSHTSVNDFMLDGVNLLHVHVLKTTPAPGPLAISVSGLVSGISCCD